MADNVTITQGTGTQIAADDIGGVQHQRVKLTLGADGVSDGDVSSSNPMPVNITASPNTLTVTENSLGVIQGLLTSIVNLLGAVQYNSGVLKVQSIIAADSVFPTLTTVTGLTNLDSIPARELIYAQQQAAYSLQINETVVRS